MRTAPWISAWRRPRGRACRLQRLHPPRLHLLNKSEPPCLRATLSPSGRGRWTSPNRVESKRKTTRRYCDTYTTPQSYTWLRVLDSFETLCTLPMFYLSSGGVHSSLIHLIWWWGRGPGEPGGQEVPWWGHHQQLQGQVSAQRQQKRDSCVSQNMVTLTHLTIACTVWNSHIKY